MLLAALTAWSLELKGAGHSFVYWRPSPLCFSTDRKDPNLSPLLCLPAPRELFSHSEISTFRFLPNETWQNSCETLFRAVDGI